MKIKTKKQAIRLFGSPERLVIALGITRQGFHLWGDRLNHRQQNELLGAAINEGYLKCKVMK